MPGASAEDRKAGASLAGRIERIRWRLWHGQVWRGLDLIAETVAMLRAPKCAHGNWGHRPKIAALLCPPPPLVTRQVWASST